jgi:hypothetical protein
MNVGAGVGVGLANDGMGVGPVGAGIVGTAVGSAPPDPLPLAPARSVEVMHPASASVDETEMASASRVAKGAWRAGLGVRQVMWSWDDPGAGPVT